MITNDQFLKHSTMDQRSPSTPTISSQQWLELISSMFGIVERIGHIFTYYATIPLLNVLKMDFIYNIIVQIVLTHWSYIEKLLLYHIIGEYVHCACNMSIHSGRTMIAVSSNNFPIVLCVQTKAPGYKSNAMNQTNRERKYIW